MKNKLLVASIWLFLLLFAGASFFIISAITSPIGPPNPPMEQTAVCNIVKNEDDIFMVTCTNNKTVMSGSPLYVARSKGDLNPFLGKKVHIRASFLMNMLNTDSVTTNMQCIQDTCKQMFNDKNHKTYAIVIEEIKEL